MTTETASYWLSKRGRLMWDRPGRRCQVLSLCIDDPDQSPAVELPMVAVGAPTPPTEDP